MCCIVMDCIVMHCSVMNCTVMDCTVMYCTVYFIAIHKVIQCLGQPWTNTFRQEENSPDTRVILAVKAVWDHDAAKQLKPPGVAGDVSF